MIFPPLQPSLFPRATIPRSLRKSELSELDELELAQEEYEKQLDEVRCAGHWYNPIGFQPVSEEEEEEEEEEEFENDEEEYEETEFQNSEEFEQSFGEMSGIQQPEYYDSDIEEMEEMEDEEMDMDDLE
ncbi:hypothetical protein K7432_009092 [Basidiobolus ranarum]|uniref:Uncharacterized protein n=1 Tax=Basidiobolus ranarum TaxID=34480 RepID=A0ABR2WR17_9FUNG